MQDARGWKRSGSGNSSAGDTGADGADGTAAKKSSQDGRTHQKKLKFSFKEQREWDTIEDEIAKLEADLEALDGQIAESATNYGKLNQLMTEKAEKEALLEEDGPVDVLTGISRENCRTVLILL